jgi:hypothetical protein
LASRVIAGPGRAPAASRVVVVARDEDDLAGAA